jgi:hypothetical protein
MPYYITLIILFLLLGIVISQYRIITRMEHNFKVIESYVDQLFYVDQKENRKYILKKIVTKIKTKYSK